MRLDTTQKLILLVSTILLIICISISPNSSIEKVKAVPTQSVLVHNLDSLLFQKRVIPNRLSHFISFLNQNLIPIHNNFELLLLLSNPIARHRLSQQLQLDDEIFLFHAELADLMQIGMSELDAQILLFSQRNYQNPFTGTTMNLQILADANAERLLDDIGGWMAGNENPIFQQYSLSIEEIESWISQANAFPFKIFAEKP